MQAFGQTWLPARAKGTYGRVLLQRSENISGRRQEFPESAGKIALQTSQYFHWLEPHPALRTLQVFAIHTLAVCKRHLGVAMRAGGQSNSLILSLSRLRRVGIPLNSPSQQQQPIWFV